MAGEIDKLRCVSSSAKRRALCEEDILTSDYAIVVTTINAPTRAMLEIRDSAPKLEARFVVIGDTKSPPDFHLNGADYLDLQEATRHGF